MILSTSTIWELLRPETEVEEAILRNQDVLRGLDWGVPRFGHPEGKVLYHIREVLDNIDRLSTIDAATRRQLRLITFLHDTFKYREDKTKPRNWSLHHSKLAYEVAHQFTDDEGVLTVIRCHDDAYHAWHIGVLKNDPDRGTQRLEQLLKEIGEHRQLYYLFFKCDTKTGDKNQAPLLWFEATVPGIEYDDC